MCRHFFMMPMLGCILLLLGEDLQADVPLAVLEDAHRLLVRHSLQAPSVHAQDLVTPAHAVTCHSYILSHMVRSKKTHFSDKLEDSLTDENGHQYSI